MDFYNLLFFYFFVFVCAKFLILQSCLPLCFLTIYFWLNSKQVLLTSVHQERTLLLRIEENPIEWENVTFHDVVRGLFIFNINILNLLFVVFYSVNIICLLISCLEGSNDYPSQLLLELLCLCAFQQLLNIAETVPSDAQWIYYCNSTQRCLLYINTIAPSSTQ